MAMNMRRGRGTGSMTTHTPRGSWQYGKRQGRAVCPKCRKLIQSGEQVRYAPGIGAVLQHAYRCLSA